MEPALEPLVDIGANLTNKAFRADLPELLDRARAAGVGDILVTGTTAQGSAEARSLAASSGAAPRLSATAGVHPHHASTWSDEARRSLHELLDDPLVVAVGECGLDFNRNYSPRDAQLQCFEAQLILAAEVQKAVFLHERDAHEDLHAILRSHRGSIVGGVVHCFTGDRRALDRYLDLDLHIGITGWITDERRGAHLLELVRDIPAGRLLIETDAPYLLPRGATPLLPRRNEPAFLGRVLAAVAEARKESEAEVALHTTRAARALFGLPTIGGAPSGSTGKAPRSHLA